jgi:hypothetical protein
MVIAMMAPNEDETVLLLGKMAWLDRSNKQRKASKS